MYKLFLSISLIFLFVFNATSQCIKGNCYTGLGIYRISNNAKYEGTFLRGKFNGKGRYYFSTGDVYSGDFKLGLRDGTGKYQYADGHYYVGGFKSDLRSGKGKLVLKDGSVYQGEWQLDQPNGKGLFTYANGTVIDGYFKNGKAVDNGNYVQDIAKASDIPNTKEEVEVNANNNHVNQQLPSKATKNTSVISLANYTLNKASLSNCNSQNCNEKNGVFTYRDGSVYYGYFKNGNPDGTGVCIYNNGDKYEGEWASHGPHGTGTLITNDNKTFSGTWEYGVIKERVYTDEALAGVNEAKRDQSKKSQNDEVEIFAVVVGVASYDHMPSLRYTDDDAYQLYAFLKSPEGGALEDDHIALLIDDAATNKNISKDIGRIFSKADANDVVLLYMSGHGLEGNFVPSDYDGYNNLLPYDAVLKLLDACPARQKVMITDACHSGGTYATKGVDLLALHDYYERFKTTNGGTAIISSSNANEVSLEYSGLRQGIFSHFLIRGMKGEADINEDGYVSVQELFDYIYQSVRSYTSNAQTPSITGLYDADMPVAMVRKSKY